ncbi:NADPH-dependent FMN reductase [Massilia sp. YIM B02769]|uniref:NADPH-dependent FMN reductase n=1 Tax=unclassified Massilia TaxID=2609279 RepID=UPI0025B70131|nr:MULTISPECIES: NADPH-dependent FMN reductase [unclassified Massilia]MDN4059703.1 NADPH-dependent FMN reductase [Massilia sp. YIM B02769]
MSVILLGGSPAPHSSSSRLLQHIGERLALHGQRLHRIEVRDLSATALLSLDTDEPSIARALAQVRQADAVVVATPVYKAAYSGLLKAFLDLLPQDGLAGKLVLPLATGGSQSHMLALDYALRPVLASMAARSILPSIYATSDQLGRGLDGSLNLAAPIAVRVAQGVEQLASELRLVAPRPASEPAAKDLHAVPA